MKKLVLILLLQTLGIAAMAGGGPHDHDFCNPKPKKVSTPTENQHVLISINSFDVVKKTAFFFTVVEKFVGQWTKYGTCDGILDILSPKSYELVYQEFSSVDYSLIRTLILPIQQDELVFYNDSAVVIGMKINNSTENLSLDCQTNAVPSGFEYIGSITGDIFGKSFNESNLACTSNLPKVDDIL